MKNTSKKKQLTALSLLIASSQKRTVSLVQASTAAMPEMSALLEIAINHQATFQSSMEDAIGSETWTDLSPWAATVPSWSGTFLGSPVSSLQLIPYFIQRILNRQVAQELLLKEITTHLSLLTSIVQRDS
jgi:hypothetical protein